MPNTDPPWTRRAIQFVLRTARATGAVRVYPIGAITQGRKGRPPAEMAELDGAGRGRLLGRRRLRRDGALMRHALEYS